MTDIQAWLDHGKTLADQATEGPWIAEFSRETGDCVIPHDAHSTREAVATTRLLHATADAAFIADARTRLPQALNALQAVLDLHKKRHPSPQMWRIAPGTNEPQPVTTPDTCDYCRGNYPCPTVRAITDAIGDPQ